jgi:hypothetical protein
MNDEDDRMSVSTQDTKFDDDMTIDSAGNNPYVEDEPFDMTVLSVSLSQALLKLTIRR